MQPRTDATHGNADTAGVEIRPRVGCFATITSFLISAGGLVGVMAVPGVAAQATSPGIRCVACGESGQRPGPDGLDPSSIPIIAPGPDVVRVPTIEQEVVARVLQLTPLVVEYLDARTLAADRDTGAMKPFEEDQPGACGVHDVEAIDPQSLAVLSKLRFNDVFTGRIGLFHQRNAKEADMLGTPVLTDVRRITPPIRFLHAAPTRGCRNRTGTLVEYEGRANDALTIYNDGGLHYRDPRFRDYDGGRLSNFELRDLMREFRAAGFDLLGADSVPPRWSPPPRLTLLAARHQSVWLAKNEVRLRMVEARLAAITARALAHTRVVLMADAPRAIEIEAWPISDVALADFRLRRDRGLMARQGYRTTIPPETRPLEQQVPLDLLARLPAISPPGDRTPGVTGYFTEAGRTYRVTKGSRCGFAGCEGTFYLLDVFEVREAEDALRELASRTAPNTGGYSATQKRTIDPDRINQYDLSLGFGPYLWPAVMAPRLNALGTAGVTISPAEYDRHRAVYNALTRGRGETFIENGLLFEHVRVCRLEPGVVDECPVK